jgi:preprotein translocase subunit SecA
MIKFLKPVFDRSAKKIKSTDKELKLIRSFEGQMKNMTFQQMRQRLEEIKSELKLLVDKIPEESKRSLVKINRRESFPAGERDVQNKLLEFMPEVYAMLNESYRRKVNQPYHDVQLRAAILLARGQILAELYTGEGKTQTFQLPLFLYSLVGRGTHLVTVNDYLTKVGAEYAGHMMHELGATVGVVAPQKSYRFITDEEVKTLKGEEAYAEVGKKSIKIDSMHGLNLVECTKKEAYECSITYCTNNELGFDYLRDNMAWDLGKLVQRELYFCIIDEADSILIDEARTPLIISSTPGDTDTDKYTKFADAVKNLVEGEDYVVEHKSRSVSLTENGIPKVEQFLGIDNLWDDFSFAYHLENALRAKSLFIKDDQYIVRNGSVYIVDEFTGRVLEGRRYSEGLHQAIEAKEGVEIKQESKTFATITFQNFFRLYKVLCGGSGTVMTESEEFYKIYGLDSVEIPTHRPRKRVDHSDRIFRSQEQKFKAVVREIKELNELGRPVLIGTTSVEKSELLSQMLDAEGIAHQVLNAKYHEQESRIVADAGKRGAVTVATNMAGRGTDIVIGGGNRGDASWQEIADLGGLHVIGTERHDSRRIDNQLRGRTGRQGEPGSTRFYASMDDQIMRILGGDFLSRLMNIIKVPEDMPIEMRIISRQIEMAQKRVEGINFDRRKSVVEYDDVMNQHREIFYTRRRNILSSADMAAGKILDNGKLIDINLPENKNKEKDYEEIVSDSLAKLESLMENTVLDAVYDQIYLHVDSESKIKKENIQAALEKIDKYIPTSMLLTVNQSDSSEKFIEDLLKLSDGNAVEEKFIESVNKTYEFKVNEFENDFVTVSKMLSLENLDQRWVDHLEIMKDVKDSISLQSYAQKDPLVEYKNMAFRMFESFIDNVNSDISTKFFRLTKVERRVSDLNADLQTNQDEIEDVLTGSREMIVDGSKKMKSVIDDIEKNANRRQSALRTNAEKVKSSGTVNKLKSYGRNDKVTVEYSDGTILEDVKFKKVEVDVESGRAKIKN